MPEPLEGRERSGEAVALLPGLVICGSPGFEGQGTDAGGVQVHRFDRGLNVWTAEPWLMVPGAGPGDGFGATVAASGSLVVVGSSSDSRVAIFDLHQPGSMPATLSGGPDFGRAVAIQGDTLVVGEPQRTGVIGPGRAIVYQRSNTGVWQAVQLLAVDSLAANAGFGSSISLRDDLLLVGAPNAAGAGAAFAFRRDDEMSPWVLSDTIVPAGLSLGDQFGAATAIGIREMLIGAPGSDLAAPNSGSAYRIPIAAGTGDLEAPERIDAPQPAANALFGSALAVTGDLLAVTAPLGNGFTGEAWIFRRNPDESISPVRWLSLDVAEPFAGFGTSIAVGGEFVAVGAAQLDASPFDPDAGAVSLYSALKALGLQDDCDGNGQDDLVDLYVTRTATDCNGNGRIDSCEIAANPSLDADNDGLLDGCVIDCPADQNLDGLLTPADFNAWLLNYNRGCP